MTVTQPSERSLSTEILSFFSPPMYPHFVGSLLQSIFALGSFSRKPRRALLRNTGRKVHQKYQTTSREPDGVSAVTAAAAAESERGSKAERGEEGEGPAACQTHRESPVLLWTPRATDTVALNVYTLQSDTIK